MFTFYGNSHLGFDTYYSKLIMGKEFQCQNYYQTTSLDMSEITSFKN